MTTFNLTCEAVEATLPDYLDETLEPWVRTSIDEHLAGCARCSSLARELRKISQEASALPALLPEDDPWPRVAGRIGVPVIKPEPLADSAQLELPTEPTVVPSYISLPMTSESIVEARSASPAAASERAEREVEIPNNEPFGQLSEPPIVTDEPASIEREVPVPLTEAPVGVREPSPIVDISPSPDSGAVSTIPVRRQHAWTRHRIGLAAAALVLITAGATFLLTVQWLGPARSPNVASEAGTQALSPAEKAASVPAPRTRAAGANEPAPAELSPAASPNQVVSVLRLAEASATPVARSPEDAVYDQEIVVLQRIVRRQKRELDTSTAAEIDNNLQSLDSALGQIRAALKQDPGNAVLDGQSSRALEMKVELLRRVAMLRPNT